MKIKINKITILICAVITVFLLGIIVNKLKFVRNQNSTDTKEFAFEKITEENVTKIEIIKQDENVILEKTDDIWMIEDQEAYDSTINTLISLLNTAKTERLVSENPDNHHIFEIGDNEATTVILYSEENEIEKILFGYYSSTGGIYARKPESNNVYSLNCNIYSIINNSSDNWIKVEEETEEISE